MPCEVTSSREAVSGSNMWLNYLNLEFSTAQRTVDSFKEEPYRVCQASGGREGRWEATGWG